MPSSPKPAEAVVGVAVPVPGLGLLSYRVAGETMPEKGARVRVPLGRRVVTGIIVERQTAAPPGTVLRDVIQVLDDAAFLPASIVDLALWVGEYYASGPGAAVAIAMPPTARGGRSHGFKVVGVAELVDGGAAPVPGRRGPRQRQALEALAGAPDRRIPLPTLAQAGIGRSVIGPLVAAGLVRIREEISERDPFSADIPNSEGWTLQLTAEHGRVLTDEQAAACGALASAADRQDFRTVLLHGVTGSGKTEVYLRLAAHVIAAKRRVLVLVPEIGLTPAVAGHFRARFGSRVAIQHSGLSAGERHDQWHRIRRGEIDVVVGTRSAVFAPLDNLGLIIVDEEQDSAYKQEDAPRYHGRDVAVIRGRMERALVVLGSATPSLESAANAASGRYDTIALRKRVLDRPLAEVEVVDMRREYAARGPDVVVSDRLADGIDSALTRGEQAIVLLNRRGYASVLFCRECGTSTECPHCSVTLTYHRSARRMRCHYCDYAVPIPDACAACGGGFLEQSGFGTERIESDLAARFPKARIARVDRDTVRRRGAIAGILRSMACGDIDVLVGTQMIAKGHDFPAVTLVGVVSADVGLGFADFRAAERTFQLLTQVVGRAGRGAIPGRAVIQTLYPDHYSVSAAARQDYAAFFERELEYRRALRYPPAVSLINVVVKDRSAARAMADAGDLAGRVRARHGSGHVVGPAPAALAKIRDEYRAQFFVKGTSRVAMRQAVVAALEARPDLKRRTIIDVDPASVT